MGAERVAAGDVPEASAGTEPVAAGVGLARGLVRRRLLMVHIRTSCSIFRPCRQRTTSPARDVDIGRTGSVCGGVVVGVLVSAVPCGPKKWSAGAGRRHRSILGITLLPKSGSPAAGGRRSAEPQRPGAERLLLAAAVDLPASLFLGRLSVGIYSDLRLADLRELFGFLAAQFKFRRAKVVRKLFGGARA